MKKPLIKSHAGSKHRTPSKNIGREHTEGPTKCPRCDSNRMRNCPVTPGGSLPWRCLKCGAVGWTEDHEHHLVSVAAGDGAKRGSKVRARRAAGG